MKRLSTALDSKLKQGRPPKYCRMCHRKLRKLIGRQLESNPLERKYMKERNITEQRCDKRKNFSSAQENSKTKQCSPLSSVAAKKYMQIIRQSRKCHIFVRNIDKTVGFFVTTSIKGHNPFTKTISMGQNQCPKCERQFARSDSLRRHLTSGICSEDMESETMSDNEDSTMSEESDAGTSRSHQKEDIFGKYEDKYYGIRDGSDTDYTDEDDEDQHYSRKKSKFDPWQVFVGGAHRYLQYTFNESVQHTVGKHPYMDRDEAEEVTFNKLEP